MDATFYYERLSAFRRGLNAFGYDIRQAQTGVVDAEPAPVLIQLPRPIIGRQTIVAIPDVHLGDGAGGDNFMDGHGGNVDRLVSTLRALRDFVRKEPFPVTLLQLGDWYDVWRTFGHDTEDSRYSLIDSYSGYQTLLSLDKELGVAHLIGNHDASFTHALPDRRVADGARFRFGFGLGGTHGQIFAIHGHQADRIEGEPSAEFDQLAVWVGALVAKFVSSDFRNLTELIDKRGEEGALIWLGSHAAELAVSQLPGGFALLRAWFIKLLAEARDDIPASPRPFAPAPNDGQRWYARFVKREHADRLAKIAIAASEKLYRASVRDLELLIVGHSHKPCISWTPHPRTKHPIVVADAGSWVFGAAQILFAASNTLAVYDIVRQGTPLVS